MVAVVTQALCRPPLGTGSVGCSPAGPKVVGVAPGPADGDGGAMDVEALPDAASFLAVTEELRTREPILTNVLASVAEGVLGGRTYESELWLVVRDEGRVVGCAMRTAPFKAALSPMPVPAGGPSVGGCAHGRCRHPASPGPGMWSRPWPTAWNARAGHVARGRPGALPAQPRRARNASRRDIRHRPPGRLRAAGRVAAGLRGRGRVCSGTPTTRTPASRWTPGACGSGSWMTSR